MTVAMPCGIFATVVDRITPKVGHAATRCRIYWGHSVKAQYMHCSVLLFLWAERVARIHLVHVQHQMQDAMVGNRVGHHVAKGCTQAAKIMQKRQRVDDLPIRVLRYRTMHTLNDPTVGCHSLRVLLLRVAKFTTNFAIAATKGGVGNQSVPLQ